MLRYKSYKKAFIMTAMVILLCLVCLTGATLALFTNDSDGTIGIITTAGKVKVDIVDANDETVSLVGGYLEFRTSSNTKEILFEPGATFYTQGFKIKNTGNIPVNFTFSISEDKKIDMKEFKEAFEVWISTSQTKPTNAQKLEDFMDGRLEPGKTSAETYYLFIKMKESVGNEFQGKSYKGIGVTVCAVQGNVNIKE